MKKKKGRDLTPTPFIADKSLIRQYRNMQRWGISLILLLIVSFSVFSVAQAQTAPPQATIAPAASAQSANDSNKTVTFSVSTVATINGKKTLLAGISVEIQNQSHSYDNFVTTKNTPVTVANVPADMYIFKIAPHVSGTDSNGVRYSFIPNPPEITVPANSGTTTNFDVALALKLANSLLTIHVYNQYNHPLIGSTIFIDFPNTSTTPLPPYTYNQDPLEIRDDLINYSGNIKVRVVPNTAQGNQYKDTSQTSDTIILPAVKELKFYFKDTACDTPAIGGVQFIACDKDAKDLLKTTPTHPGISEAVTAITNARNQIANLKLSPLPVCAVYVGSSQGFVAQAEISGEYTESVPPIMRDSFKNTCGNKVGLISLTMNTLNKFTNASTDIVLSGKITEYHETGHAVDNTIWSDISDTRKTDYMTNAPGFHDLSYPNDFDGMKSQMNSTYNGILASIWCARNYIALSTSITTYCFTSRQESFADRYAIESLQSQFRYTFDNNVASFKSDLQRSLTAEEVNKIFAHSDRLNNAFKAIMNGSYFTI